MNTLNQWKHWPAFWQLVREHNVCPESDKERLGECEISLHFEGYNSNNFNRLCFWEWSLYAGYVMILLSAKQAGIENLDLSTYINSSPVTIVSPVYAPPNTIPLPIVKPCHRCGMEHDEAYPTEACKRLMDAEQETERINNRIKELESRYEELKEAATNPEMDIDDVYEVIRKHEGPHT